MSKPVVYIPNDALDKLKPPMIRLLGVPLITYHGEDHTPLYLHPDPRVAKLEAVLRECLEALIPYMKYVDGTNVLNHPAQCVAKIDSVLPKPLG